MEVVLIVGLPLVLLVTRAHLTRAHRRARLAGWRDRPWARPAEPFRGYKVAQLMVAEPGSAWLTGVTNRPCGIDGVAACERRTCEPPGLDCDCGFYAFRNRLQALELLAELTRRHRTRSYVVLTVDLDGVVLEYERGFRAARQRVHRVEVPAGCLACLREGGRWAQGALVTHPSFRSEQVVLEGAAARGVLPFGSAPVRGACVHHQPGPSGRTVSVMELRAALTTEVDLLPLAAVPLGCG